MRFEPHGICVGRNRMRWVFVAEIRGAGSREHPDIVGKGLPTYGRCGYLASRNAGFAA
jgi:hypothetical protein